jgi:hypothetical protein
METTSFTDFIQRYNNIQAYEASKDKLLQDVLIYCKAIESDSDKENQKLQARLNEVELDLKAATKTRRDLQKSLEEAELQVKWVMRQNDEIKNTNSYVLILIDGDGLLVRLFRYDLVVVLELTKQSSMTVLQNEASRAEQAQPAHCELR